MAPPSTQAYSALESGSADPQSSCPPVLLSVHGLHFFKQPILGDNSFLHQEP